MSKRECVMKIARLCSFTHQGQKFIEPDEAMEYIKKGYVVRLEGLLNDPERGFDDFVVTSPVESINGDRVETRSTVYKVKWAE